MTTSQQLQTDVLYPGAYEERILTIPDGSIDLVLTDPPYGVTACEWDTKPDLAFMWRQFNRVIPDHGAVVMTATQPFATDVINANRKFFRYDLVWAKSNPVGFLNAKRMPLRQHELVLVFYRTLPTYNPQMVAGERRRTGGRIAQDRPGVYARYKTLAHESSQRYPTSLLPFDKEGNGSSRHPTQKPVSLFEYLIRTYTLPGAVVLDPFMGSGTTAVAAKQCGRHFIGFERDLVYYHQAEERIRQTAVCADSLDTFMPSMN